VATTTGYAYTVKREYYCQILSALYQIRKTHGNLILTEGYLIPKLPLWGKRGDISKFHLENEYEILAICFRTEVESFLITIDRHYNFLTGTPRSADLIIDVPSRDLPPHFPSAPATLSLGSVHEEVVAGPKRLVVTERINTWLETGGPRSHRQSNLYNFGSNILEDCLQKSHPEGTPCCTLHTNKLREVLGDTELPQDELPDDAVNQPPICNARARSDDLERNSTSTRVFQNRHQRRMPLDNGPRELEDEEADGECLQGLKDYSKKKDRVNNFCESTAEPFKSNSKESRGLHFEDKLKLSNVPTWNGNTDTIILWLSKVNNLAQYSKKIHDQLGSIVPWRLEGVAENWYWSLPYLTGIRSRYLGLC